MTQKTMRNLLTKECAVCKKVFEQPYSCSVKSWELRKNCSKECQTKYWIGRKDGRKKTGTKNSVPAWNKGLKSKFPAWNKGKGDYAKALGFGKWMSGKKLSLETRKKQSETTQKRIKEGRHNFYIDGRTPERISIRHSLDYKLWREAVFKRDNYTCQCCDERGGYLEAHHIKSFSEYPELRFAIDNGISYCQMCHAKTDPLRARTLTKTQCQL